MDADLFERWFVIADQDHDGMVSGSEAVEFFGRSNLSQDTLFQVPGVYSDASAKAPDADFPPMSAADAQRYQQIFQQMDADRDNYVLGGECFGYFMQWGLPKAMLKDIWEVVAGDEGRLTQRQFVSCIYLMGRAKRGAPLPQRLPPGQFPPIAESGPSTGSQQHPVSLSAGIQADTHDVFSKELQIPGLPAKVHYSSPAQSAYAPRVPQPDVSGLNAVERTHVQSEQRTALGQDQQLYEAQMSGQAAKERAEVYKAALQELTLFKSRTSAALLQAQERADKETREANMMQAQYEAAWTNAESTHAQGRQLLDSLTKARSRKVEAQSKLEQLQRDIAELSSLSPDTVASEEEVTHKLQQEIKTAEEQAARLEMRADGARAERRRLEAAVEEVQLSCAAGQADLAALRRDLGTLEAKLQAEDGEASTQLKALLKATAEVYLTLLSNAHRAGIAVPPEALLRGLEAAGKGAPRWNDFAALEAEDWEDFEDEGFQVIDGRQRPASGAESEPAGGHSKAHPEPHPEALGSQHSGHEVDDALTEPRSSADHDVHVPEEAPAAQQQPRTATQHSDASAGFAVDFGDTATSSEGATTLPLAPFASFGEDTKPKASTAQDGWAAF